MIINQTIVICVKKISASTDCDRDKDKFDRWENQYFINASLSGHFDKHLTDGFF